MWLRIREGTGDDNPHSGPSEMQITRGHITGQRFADIQCSIFQTHGSFLFLMENISLTAGFLLLATQHHLPGSLYSG